MDDAQLSLFDAARERDAALQRVDDAADPAWKERAYTFLVEYAQSHPTVFPPDLFAAGLPHAREDRALGPIFLRAARAGIIRKSGRMRPSTSSHLTDRPVWDSLIYRGDRDPRRWTR